MTENPVAARARRLVGVRFRPQGRRVEQGLDCVGLAALAVGLPAASVPRDYSLRSEADAAEIDRALSGRARRIATEEAIEGDVLLVRAGLGQSHLVVLTSGGFVHADVRHGKVVERPGPVGWAVRAAWRATEFG